MIGRLNGFFVVGMVGLVSAAMAQQPAPAKASPTAADAPAASSPQAASATPGTSASTSPPTAAAPPATSASAAPPPSPGPSPDMLKKARSLGMHAQTRSSGATVFCWEDADIGTRFTTKKCATEAQLEQVIEQKELLRDQMRRGMTGSSSK